jgi:hypothetical protein
MMEGIRSSETSVFTTIMPHSIPEDGILRSHRRENLKTYLALIGWVLQQRRSVFSVKYELSFYILETGTISPDGLNGKNCLN